MDKSPATSNCICRNSKKVKAWHRVRNKRRANKNDLAEHLSERDKATANRRADDKLLVCSLHDICICVECSTSHNSCGTKAQLFEVIEGENNRPLIGGTLISPDQKPKVKKSCFVILSPLMLVQ